MKYQWLENMVTEGSIRKEAADKIYQDCQALLSNSDAIIKEANMGPPPGSIPISSIPIGGIKPGMSMGGLPSGAPRGDWMSLQTLGPIILGGLASQVLSGALNWAVKRHSISNAKDDVEEARKQVMNKFPQDKAKANARFSEILSLAPLVASKPSLAAKIIERTLHSGLAEDDEQKLLQMQSHMAPGYETTKELSKHGSAPLRLEVVGEIAADMVSLVKTANVDGNSFLRQYIPKLLLMAGIPLAGSAVAGGVNMLRTKLKEQDLKRELENTYKKVLELSDPDKEPLHANHEEARRAFDTLAHFAPNVALQPQAARAFMNKLTSVNSNIGIVASDLKDLTEIEKNMAQAKGQDPFLLGLGEGAKHLGMSDSVGEAGKELAKSLVGPMFGHGNHNGFGRRRG